MKGFIAIKTPDNHTTEELYELMQREGKFDLPYELQGSGMMQKIQFPLKGNNVIQIAASKTRINVVTAKGSMAKDVGLHALTGGWSSILDSSKKDNQAILESVAAEVRRLTGGK